MLGKSKRMFVVMLTNNFFDVPVRVFWTEEAAQVFVRRQDKPLTFDIVDVPLGGAFDKAEV